MFRLAKPKDLLTLILALCLSVNDHGRLCAGPYHETGFEGRIMAFLELSMETEGIMGLSVGFAGPDGYSWAAGLGYADHGQDVRASQYTVYPVASLTKMFTNIAVMQLMGQGLLNLDKPVSAYLPEFKIMSRFDDQPPMLVRHLLGHYAGLPRDLYKGIMAQDPSVRPGLFEHLAGQYVAYPPGIKYLYSNLGYELLGKLIENLSGESFEDYIQERVLVPLGMAHSGFRDKSSDPGSLSGAYIRWDETAYREMPHNLRASGGLYSNTRDMVELLDWILATGHREPRVGDALLQMMWRDQKTAESLDIGLQSGWSWIMEEYPEPMEGFYAYQIGSTMHYNAVMAVAPAHHMGVVLLCNTGGVLDALEEMARLIILAAIQQERGQSFPADEPPPEVPFESPPQEALDGITGLYLLQNELFRVSSLNGELVFTTQDQTMQAMYHADGWFSISEGFRFKALHWDDTRVLVIDRNGSVFPAGIDITDRYILPAELFAKLGSYRLTGVDPEIEEVIYQEARVLLDEGIMKLELVLSPHQQRVFGYEYAGFNLIPAGPGEAIIGGFGMYKGETVFFDVDDEKRYIRFAGLRFLKTGH